MDGQQAVDAYKSAALIDQSELDASSDSSLQTAARPLVRNRPQVGQSTPYLLFHFPPRLC